MVAKSFRLTKTECACANCQLACQHTPGWFRPGEAERAAKLLGLTLRQFFKKCLRVNYWEAEENVYVLSPAVVERGQTGDMAPANPKGTCVFFQNNRCAIYAARPHDCAYGNPCEGLRNEKKLDAAKRDHERTVALWKAHQAQIRQLLGRKPEAEPYSFLEALYW